MESSRPLTITCSKKKRKTVAQSPQMGTKRLKTEEKGDGDHQRRPSGPARLSVCLDRLQQPITLAELMELLHFASLGKTRGIQQPSWCRLHHQRKVSGVNVVIVDGPTQSLFYKNYLSMEHLRTSYTTRMTFTSSSNNVASDIFDLKVPSMDFLSVSKPKETLHKALKHHPVITTFGTQKKGLTAYVLSQQQMIKHHYPVKGVPGFEEFLCTDSDVCVTDESPLYGLDCEMCLTERGYELTRVSLVDSDGNCVLDDLVKPQNRVLNYLTKFSGITAAMLRPITTTLREVQEKIRKLLPANAVLVGHSLNNDLIALKLIHQHVIDTSLLYRREFGQKFKLKVLAEAVLKRQIQTEEKKGHDPTEDAVAALNLAQYFIKTGPRQVVELHLEELWGYTLEEQSPECTPVPRQSYRFADILQTLGRSVAFIGKRADVALDLSQQCWCSSDKEMLTYFRKQTKHPFLSVLQFSSLSDHLKRSCVYQQHLYHDVCANLQDMCAVFAGPFPDGFSKRDVRRLFSCCGKVQRVKMLNTTVRLHAKVEFQMLEGAMLALKVLDGLSVLGHMIKVQRPVKESMLDLDLNLEALMSDKLNTKRLYAVKLCHDATQHLNISATVNGCLSDAKCSGFCPDGQKNGLLQAAETNGKQLHTHPSTSDLCEESFTETFGIFGSIKSIVLSGKRARHACIEFKSPDSRRSALSSSEQLLRDGYLTLLSVTPSHLPSWVSMTTLRKSQEEEMETAEEQSPDVLNSFQGMDLLKKLDRRLSKVFSSLPDGTLSVVLLVGLTRKGCDQPGLCFLEVKK